MTYAVVDLFKRENKHVKTDEDGKKNIDFQNDLLL